MELRHLRYFVGVAEMENVSRAALKLHVSQCPYSVNIAKKIPSGNFVRVLTQTWM